MLQPARQESPKVDDAQQSDNSEEESDEEQSDDSDKKNDEGADQVHKAKLLS